MSLPDAALRSGCSSSFRPDPAAGGNGGTPNGNNDGAVDGGDALVAGTQIQLVATGSCGHGAASISLIFTSTNGSLWVAEATPTKNFTCRLGGYTVNSSYGLTSMAANGLTTCTAAPMSTAPATGDCASVPDPAGNVWVANADGTVSKMLGMAAPVVTPPVPGRFATAP